MSQHSYINPKAIERYKALQQPPLSIEAMLRALQDQDYAVLSQAITLLESTQEAHKQKAQELITACIPLANTNAVRIGITGVPGVGKSTFIEVLTQLLIAQGKRVAILAVDPSSAVSGGSILGDKTRMEAIVGLPEVFIRPSPSGTVLGGVAQQTRAAILLCETAGFDIIFVETVGVGQSETTVRSMVDYFLLLQLAGAGDDLQGIKRGIMEMADGVVITKADGTNVTAAKKAMQMLQQVLHIYPVPQSQCAPQVLCCSAQENFGIEHVWQQIQQYLTTTKTNGFFEQQRLEQQEAGLYQMIAEELKRQFYQDPKIQKALPAQLKAIQHGRKTPFSAAQYLLALKSQ